MKKLRTRRQIALRRILAAMLCLLVLVGLSVLRKLPYLSPSSAIAAAGPGLRPHGGPGPAAGRGGHLPPVLE